MVEKIILKIGDKKIKLTIEEALQLKQDLNDMYRDEHTYYPGWPEYYPVVWPQYPLSPPYDRWYTTAISDRTS